MSMMIMPSRFGVASSAYADAVLASSPYIYYRMDEASGTSLHDSSGGGRDGIISGTAGTDYVLAQPGLVDDTDTAIQFKTNAGYVRASAAQTFPLTNVTLSCAVKTDVGAAAGFIMGLYQDTDPTLAGGSRDRLFYINTSGGVTAYFWAGAIKSISSPSAINDGVRRLIHFAIGTSSSELYINGASVGTIASVPTANFSGYLFGAMNNVSGQPGGANAGMRGVIDEMVWFNTRLSADTILAQAQAAGLA